MSVKSTKVINNHCFRFNPFICKAYSRFVVQFGFSSFSLHLAVFMVVEIGEKRSRKTRFSSVKILEILTHKKEEKRGQKKCSHALRVYVGVRKRTNECKHSTIEKGMMNAEKN